MNIFSINYGKKNVFDAYSGKSLSSPIYDSFLALVSIGDENGSYENYNKVWPETLEPIARVNTHGEYGAVGLFANQALLKSAPDVTLSPIASSLAFAFTQCYALNTLPLLSSVNWHSVTNFSGFCALSNRENTDVIRVIEESGGSVGLSEFPALDLSHAELLINAFAYQSFLMVPDLVLTNAVTVRGMFYGCERLMSVGPISFGDTDVDADDFFSDCHGLDNISEIDFTHLIGTGFFTGCEMLRRVGVAGIISHDLSFADSPLLEDETLLALCYHTTLGEGTLAFNNALSAKANQYVKFDGETLVWCESTDPETQGTLASFMTSKGWSLVFV